MNNFADAFQKVQNMLSTEEGQRQIRGIMDSFNAPTAANSQGFNEQFASSPSSPPAMDSMGGSAFGTLGNLFAGMGNMGAAGGLPPSSAPITGSPSAGASKAQLLHALRPHLSSRRLGKFDTAVKLMQVSQFANVRNLNGISNILNIFGG